MRHVFLPIASSDGEAVDSGMGIAVRLARTVNGRLTVIRETLVDAPSGEWPTAAVSVAVGLSPADRQQLDRAGIPWDVRNARDAVEAACRSAGAAHGVVVMAGRPEAEIAMALTDYRLPVLAIPKGTPSFAPEGEALILWNGSKSATHALATALPLLAAASQVTVLEIDDGSLRHPGREAIASLSRHGIAAHLRHEPAFGEKAGLVLLEQIAAIRPAYVVMGGFGHARWIESAIGGVTRRLLTECDLPLFLKH